jgi:prolyl-tRNA editing enzyme YbaK/EbsC (Cys-tRNA(Pro) deacylase)
MDETLSPSARRVQEALRALGFDNRVIRVPTTTRTAQEAARTISCTVGQIVKSIMFKGMRSGQPILVIASGSNRVDERIIANLVGEPIGKADADYVREMSGYVIGGVPPLAHRVAPRVFLDQDLFQYEEAWAAAGTPFEIFCVTGPELEQMTNGQVICLDPAVK